MVLKKSKILGLFLVWVFRCLVVVSLLWEQWRCCCVT